MILDKKFTLWFLLFLFFFYSCNIDFYNPFEDTYNPTPAGNQVFTPTFSPAGGTYNSDQDVTIACGTGGVAIHYTMDGSDPNGSSTVYSTAISVSGHGTNMTV
jgi:hypothetical protein